MRKSGVLSQAVPHTALTVCAGRETTEVWKEGGTVTVLLSNRFPSTAMTGGINPLIVFGFHLS